MMPRLARLGSVDSSSRSCNESCTLSRIFWSDSRSSLDRVSTGLLLRPRFFLAGGSEVPSRDASSALRFSTLPPPDLRLRFFGAGDSSSTASNVLKEGAGVSVSCLHRLILLLTLLPATIHSKISSPYPPAIYILPRCGLQSQQCRTTMSVPPLRQNHPSSRPRKSGYRDDARDHTSLARLRRRSYD